MIQRLSPTSCMSPTNVRVGIGKPARLPSGSIGVSSLLVSSTHSRFADRNSAAAAAGCPPGCSVIVVKPPPGAGVVAVDLHLADAAESAQTEPKPNWNAGRRHPFARDQATLDGSCARVPCDQPNPAGQAEWVQFDLPERAAGSLLEQLDVRVLGAEELRVREITGACVDANKVEARRCRARAGRQRGRPSRHRSNEDGCDQRGQAASVVCSCHRCIGSATPPRYVLGEQTMRSPHSWAVVEGGPRQRSSSGTRRSTGRRARSSSRRSRCAEIPEYVAERLRYPERAVILTLPVRMDDGARPLVPGLPRAALLRARPDEGRHPLRRGRQPRRVRGARDVDDVEVRAPAAPLRRREGRRPLQPARALAGRARARHAPLHRRARAVHRPADDIPAPDMATNEQTMAWMMDTYSMQKGYAVPGDRHRQADLDRRLGLPARGDRRRRRDGDRARLRAARLEPRRAALRRPGLRQRRRGRRDRAARARRDRDRRSPTSRAASSRPDGLDIPTLHEYAREHGSLEGYPATQRLSNEELLELECDVLVLAAREDQVTERERRRAPLPARRRGRERPDLGRRRRDPRRARDPGAARRAHERRRRHRLLLRVGAGPGRLFWDRDEIRRRLAEKLGDAFDRVWDALRGATAISLRDAALVAGIREVAAALEARGIYP